MSPTQYAKLPQNIQSEVIFECAKELENKRFTLFVKRVFDLVVSLILTIVLSPLLLFCVIAVAVGRDGPVLFKQKRIGRYGEEFEILKFRTMTHNASGSAITVDNDNRITKAGSFMRKLRLDELPQLFNVIRGDMSLVGPRPEVKVYVDQYKPDWRATLLVRPGVTCRSSIYFADEATMMKDTEDTEKFYVDIILPEKCRINIDYVKGVSLIEDIKTMFATVKKVL